MPTLRAGALRERIDFLALTTVSDHGFATTSYAAAFSVWAAANLKGGAMDFTQDRADPKLAVDFDVRYRADITSAMKVAWRGMTFEIAGPLQLVPVEGRLTIPCLQESYDIDITALGVFGVAIFGESTFG